eukprot:974933-Heterocapsa_arctica.AAC.1
MKRRRTGDAYLAHRLLSGEGWPDDGTLQNMGGFVPQKGRRSLYGDLQIGNMALAVDFYYPHLLRHDLSICQVGSSRISIEEEIRKGRTPPVSPGKSWTGAHIFVASATATTSPTT